MKLHICLAIDYNSYKILECFEIACRPWLIPLLTFCPPGPLLREKLTDNLSVFNMGSLYVFMHGTLWWW